MTELDGQFARDEVRHRKAEIEHLKAEVGIRIALPGESDRQNARKHASPKQHCFAGPMFAPKITTEVEDVAKT
jgi:hypothetical protein